MKNRLTVLVLALSGLLLTGCANNPFSTTKAQGLTPRVRYIQAEAAFNAAVDSLDVAAKAGKIPATMKPDLKLAVIAAQGALDAAAPVVADPKSPLINVDTALAAVQTALDKLAEYRLKVGTTKAPNGSTQ